MKKLLGPLFVLFCMMSIHASAQEQSTPQKKVETFTQHFRVVQMPEGLTEKTIKTFFAQQSSLVAVNECSFNAATGDLKMAINAGASMADVLKVFHDHQCVLTFYDRDGIQKRYDPKLNQIVPVTAR